MMNLSYLFAVIALTHLVLLAISFRSGGGFERWLIRALLLGLVFDNSILALSGCCSDAAWYYSASWFRYVAHVLVLPPLLLVTLQIMHRAGIKWAGSQPVFLVASLLVVLGISVGLVTEIAGLELVRASLWEHVRFVNMHASPPVATIVTSFLVLILSAVLWRRSAWPWLFAAALLILLVNGGLAGREWSIVAGNLAEVIFASAWVLTLMRFNAPIDNSHLPAG